MALKVKANERLQKIGTYAGTYRYVMANVNEVSTGLITSRRIIFTPAVSLKDELVSTGIIISCYDRDGNEVKRVTSKDAGDVEADGDVDSGGNDGGGDMPPAGGY